MGSKPPCMGCDKRCIGCHSVCNNYKEWAEQRKQITIEQNKLRECSIAIKNIKDNCVANFKHKRKRWK